MSIFASNRERRLWLWALAAVVAVYGTLGLATTLAGTVPDHNLIVGGFLLSMLLVAATIVTQGLKTRPGGLEIGVVLGIAVVYFLVFLRMTMPERSHLMEYSVVAVLIYEALTERRSQGRRVPVPALLAILGTSLVGVLDECIQLFLPSRVFDPTDMLFNALAAIMAVLGMVMLGWARRWGRKTHRNRYALADSRLTLFKAIATVMATAIGFGITGAGIGAILGEFTPGFFLLLPIPDVEAIDPLELGMGLGLFNGVTWGLVIGVIVVIIISWKEARVSRKERSDSGVEPPNTATDTDPRLVGEG